VTEAKLPNEVEEQVILHALGMLNPEERQVFMAGLQGGSDLLCQTTAAYERVADALATAMAPVTPPPTLRERLVTHISLEIAREAEQFERAASTVALNAVPIKPRDSVREQLLSRIQGHSGVRVDAKDSAQAYSGWLHSWWNSVSTFLRTLFIRSVTPRPSSSGLVFVKASEGKWWRIAPGVTAKVLSFDSASRRTTTILRFAPGTNYAPHRHAAVEELYVLEGGCTIAGRAMRVGDYHRAEAGTVHHDTSTDEGCLLLVISSPQNELLR
jgi:quercetin dioxygenase-like cupin family protein